jgi:hypothetical protein
MRLRRPLSIKVMALGFAAAAIGAPSAQAMPDDLTGEDARAIRQSSIRAGHSAARATNRTVPARRPRRPIRVPDESSDLGAAASWRIAARL